jgi:AbrB family looped-hinge helix DNA binding protein
MAITKLKAKNQLTIPKSITEKFDIREGCLFSVEAQDNFIKLMPVEIEPRWTPEELKTLDRIVEKEKGNGIKVKLGKEFSDFVDGITKQ